MIREKFISDVLAKIRNILPASQLDTLKDILVTELYEYDLIKKTTELSSIDETPIRILNTFIFTKQIEGKSSKTLKRYYSMNHSLIQSIDKPLNQISTYDIRFYLATYQQKRKVSNHTLDGMRRCFASFFSWLAAENFITKNPCLAISQIKYPKTIKKPFSSTDMKRIESACTNPRDLSIVSFLYASGCRVSEVVGLNRDDIDFISGDAIVFGKGAKERKIYLTEVAIMHLKDYLLSRKDSNPCLFATLKSPYRRLSKAGIESVLKRLGKLAGIENVHPHRYRRTLATNLLDRGAPIQDVAAVLGHADLKTTQIYCYISQKNVRNTYKKFAE